MTKTSPVKTRNRQAPERASPQRTCVVTRETHPVEALIRFVVAPDGTVAPDLRRRLPGRGAWVTASRDVVETAVRKRRLEPALGLAGPVDPGLADQVDALLQRAAVAALSMARKAGEAVQGFVKVGDAIDRGRAVALVQAPDAGDGARKLAARWRRSRGDAPVVIDCFKHEDLDLAFGRTNVIHAALLAGRAGDNALRRAAEWVRYRDGRVSPSGGRNPDDDLERTMDVPRDDECA